MKIKLSLLLILFTFLSAFAQQFQLSEDSKVSVLTFGPGDNLNDAFGHSAFRIKDNTIGLDVVYGYGQYDFDIPNFYLKFAQGRLNYLISRHKFLDIYQFYSSYNRTITEQILNLSSVEKQKLFNYLENNYKPKNRRYLYDFFFDNCATRIKDVTQVATANIIEFELPKNYKPKTFRQLIHEQVGLNTWGSFGIDIALGSVIDTKAQPEEQMFLPKYIHDFFGAAKLNNSENLVKSESVLFEAKGGGYYSNFMTSPIVVMFILGVFIILLTYKDYKNNTRSKWLDITIFSLTGVIGIFIFLLWAATDHAATSHNYNLLWAFPLNLIVLRQLLKKEQKKWVKGYLKFLILMLCLMTLHWLIGVQVFALGLIPLLVAFLVRYIFLLKCINKN